MPTPTFGSLFASRMSSRGAPARVSVAAVAVCATVGAASVLTVAPAGATPGGCTPAPSSESFDYTGGPQTFTPPAGVVQFDVTLAGASGGSHIIPPSTIPSFPPDSEPQVDPGRTFPGGAGAEFSTRVSPGDTLYVVVGGAGGDTMDGGGGRGQGGGGGTFLYVAEHDINSLHFNPWRPVAVAGGGGGAGYGTPGQDAVAVIAGGRGFGGAGTSDSGGGGGGGFDYAGTDGGPGDGAGVAPTTTGGKGGQAVPSLAGGAGGTMAGHDSSSGTAGGYGGGGGGGAGSYLGGGGGGGGGYAGGAGGSGGSGSSTGRGGAAGTSYTYGYLNNPGQNIGNGWVTISWTPPQATQVTTAFDTQGGGTAPTSQTTTSGCAADAPADPTRDGHSFTGWFTAPTGGSLWDFSTPVTSDSTLYAQWQSDVVTVDGDGDGVPDADDNCPAVANPGQADADQDGRGNSCEATHARTISLDVTHRSAPRPTQVRLSGDLSVTDDADRCIHDRGIKVFLARYNPSTEEWNRVAISTTNADGHYAALTPDRRGTYRARIKRDIVGFDGVTSTCTRAVTTDVHRH